MKTISSIFIFLIAFTVLSAFTTDSTVKEVVALTPRITTGINPCDTIIMIDTVKLPAKIDTVITIKNPISHDVIISIGAFFTSLIWQVLRFFFPAKFIEYKKKQSHKY